MKIARLGLLVLGAAMGCIIGQALLAEGFPPAHELFKPLQADPRELQYSLRLVDPVSHKVLGEADIGDYLGFYRWTLDSGAQVQVSGGGGAFGRFDLAATSNDMKSVDFFGNIPFDVRFHEWSSRFMIYHTSSHLGDDYIKMTGITPEKHGWDSLRWLLSYDMGQFLRFYGGYTYAFRTLPENIGRSTLQSGFEVRSAWKANHVQFYWANDLQSAQRSAWNGMLNSQAGVHLADHPGATKGVSLFVEFGTGPQPQGQFYLQHETHWDGGIQFFLS